MFVLLTVLSLALFSREVCNQEVSPCPDVFSYEIHRAENDKWYGSVSLQSADDLTGVWLTVQLDRPAELLGNWFGDTFTTDNQSFRISNSDYKLEAGPPVKIVFFVQYDPRKPIPSLKLIRLNGKTICSSAVSENDLRPTTPKLHISHQPKPTSRPAGSAKPSGGQSNSPNIYDSSVREPENFGTGYEEQSGAVSNTRNPEESGYIQGNLEGTGDFQSNARPFTRPTRRPSAPNFGNPEGSGYIQGIIEGTGDIQSNARPVTRPTRRPSAPNSGTGYEEQSGGVSNTRNPEGSGYIQGNPEGTSDIQSIARPFTRPTRRPSAPNSGSSSSDESSYSYPSGLDYFPGDFSAIKKPAHNNRSSSSSDRLNGSDKTPSCGTVATHAAPLISNGQDTVPGQWPWHVALYHSKGIQLIYICGATLVSEKYLLTAAHCVTRPNTNKPVDTESILAYLGKYNLITFGSEVQDRDISDIYINPQYNHTFYYNDIAILRMSRAADINNHVRPCCLWDDDNTNLESIISLQGTVVGWGFDKNKKLTNELMQAYMPVVSTLNCILSNRDFFSRFMSDTNFCAGFRNGTSVCNGDSGGSMVFPRRGTRGQNTVWQIRGIVSVGVALHDEGVCDTSQYVIFTDVAKYLVWIRQILSN